MKTDVHANPEAQDALREEFILFRTDFEKIRTMIAKTIVGQNEIVINVLIACVAGGHVLLEGVPGLGKTLLVRTLADSLNAKFSRIQFTPDLMPADLTGTNMMTLGDDGSRRFEFRKGPLFGNIILADEINRATPKTQSALLEAMQEHAITAGGQTHSLEGLFFVLATQNPLEMEGTWPLPEAQLDRFFCKILVPVPTASEIQEIVRRTTGNETAVVSPVLSANRLLEMGRLARRVPVADEILAQTVDLVCRTHPATATTTDAVRRYVRYGASPRGAQYLLLAAKVHAILNQRLHVAYDDIKSIAPMVLRHRILLNFEGQAEGIHPDEIIGELLHG
ncbi:MAG: MoxR family ATPase [Planctomycetia bacterium]|nr:MoxR family ATPase [Planctomycetia bacterium]